MTVFLHVRFGYMLLFSEADPRICFNAHDKQNDLFLIVHGEHHSEAFWTRRDLVFNTSHCKNSRMPTPSIFYRDICFIRMLENPHSSRPDHCLAGHGSTHVFHQQNVRTLNIEFRLSHASAANLVRRCLFLNATLTSSNGPILPLPIVLVSGPAASKQ